MKINHLHTVRNIFCITFKKIKYKGFEIHTTYELEGNCFVCWIYDSEGQKNLEYSKNLALCLWNARKFILQYNTQRGVNK
jgi:hypothetical protein